MCEEQGPTAGFGGKGIQIMRKLVIGAAMAALVLPLASTPAFAQPDEYDDGYSKPYGQDGGDDEERNRGGKYEEIEPIDPDDDYMEPIDPDDQVQPIEPGNDDVEPIYPDDDYVEPIRPEDRYPREHAQDDGKVWRGDDGRRYCRRSDGTAGLVVGGGAGALIGRAIDSGGSRGAGTILGGVLGALIGRAVERDATRCR